MIEHRKSTFSEEFERILYVIPENCRAQRQEFIESLEKLLPGKLEVLEGWPKSLEEKHLTYSKASKLLGRIHKLDITPFHFRAYMLGGSGLKGGENFNFFGSHAYKVRFMNRFWMTLSTPY